VAATRRIGEAADRRGVRRQALSVERLVFRRHHGGDGRDGARSIAPSSRRVSRSTVAS
jgi:hypothetical protein